MKWKKTLASPTTSTYPFLFKEQLEKNAVLITTLQIAHDAIKAIADEEDPEKLKAIAKATIKVMNSSLRNGQKIDV